MTSNDSPTDTSSIANPIDALEIRVLDLTPEQTVDFACELILKLDAMKKRLREIGSVTYYLAEDKETKCIDMPTTLDAIFNVAAGDMSMACDGLSVNAFKPGWAKKNLPADVYGRCFKTETKNKLKTDDGSKPVKQLQKVDANFVR